MKVKVNKDWGSVGTHRDGGNGDVMDFLFTG